MGGIEVGLDTKVKGFKNLYAIGEVACNGVHGANRLASNSLLEGLVFSRIAVNNSLKENFKISKENYTKEIKVYTRNKNIDKEIKDDLRRTMWETAGIVRSKKELKEALERIENYLKLDVGRLLYLRLLTARTILKASLKREKSLGAHFIKED
jgi:L-aspartate oxidase